MKNLDILMDKIKEGDENAFEVLYINTKDKVFYLILSILKSYQLSEDVLQDTYIKVRLNIQKYKSSNPLAWIMTIARNLALNVYNKHKKECQLNEINQKEFVTEESFASFYNIELMVKNLSNIEKEIVILHALHNFKHKEIAKIVNKPLGTVLWIYSKAMKKLKAELSEGG